MNSVGNRHLKTFENILHWLALSYYQISFIRNGKMARVTTDIADQSSVINLELEFIRSIKTISLNVIDVLQ